MLVSLLFVMPWAQSRALTEPALGILIRSQPINVFVSYSHADAALVAPVVRLLRVNRSLVFQDTDRILPGKRWRDEIAKALGESNLVVVFWCHHAFRSNEVSKEWRAAIELDKDLLPLLLDSTPLPSELRDFQWIDFRGTVGANHDAMGLTAEAAQPGVAPPRPVAAPQWRAAWYTVYGVAAAAAVVLSTLLVWPADVSGPLTHVGGASDAVLNKWVPLLLGVVGLLSACLLWLWHRRTKRVWRSDAAGPHAGEIERQIATELEAEILRRATPAHDDRA